MMIEKKRRNLCTRFACVVAGSKLYSVVTNTCCMKLRTSELSACVLQMAHKVAATDTTNIDDVAKEKRASNQTKVKEVEGKSWETRGGKKPNLYTPCGKKHEWKQWTQYVTHCKKFRCEREGCGFFKKCWAKCVDIDCNGCHVIAHKRW